MKLVHIIVWRYSLQNLLSLKNLNLFKISLKSLIEISKGSLTKLAGLLTTLFSLEDFLSFWVLEVNLDTTFCLNVLLFLLV